MTPAVIASYEDLLAVLRARADEIGATRLQVDAASGLPDGYAGKLLGPSKIRCLGEKSLGPVLGALGLKLVAVADDESLNRVCHDYPRRHKPKQADTERIEAHVKPLRCD